MEKKDSKQRIQAIKHIMDTVFSAQNALRTLAPEFKWAGLGNLLGDYGECVGIDYYNLNRCPNLNGISLDSREILTNDIFIAINGENENGHNSCFFSDCTSR